MFNKRLDQIAGWVIKRKDGTIVRHLVDGSIAAITRPAAGFGSTGSVVHYPSTSGSLSAYCDHEAKMIYETDKFQLFIADAAGCRKVNGTNQMDLIIDSGNVLVVNKYPTIAIKKLYSHDSRLASELEKKYAITPPAAHVTPYLQIDWADRQAPLLKPEFWIDLASRLKGKILVNCQGGHGRSGTSAVCLMMATSEYDALQAIIHLRAIHCPRAIESKVQHDYINLVARALGRSENAHDSEGVKNFREAFRNLSTPTAKRFQHLLEVKSDPKPTGVIYPIN